MGPGWTDLPPREIGMVDSTRAGDPMPSQHKSKTASVPIVAWPSARLAEQRTLAARPSWRDATGLAGRAIVLAR